MNADNFMGWLVIALSQLGSLMLILRKISGKPEQREITPQPLMVQEVKQLEARFAPRDHGHSEYLTRGEWREACIRQHGEDTAKLNRIESKVDAVPMVVSAAFKELESKAEVRASKLHARIDNLSPEISAVRSRVEDHLQDHRAGRH